MANGYNRNNNDSGEIKEIINEINQVKMLSDISAKQYADENGYADKIAKNSKDLKTTQLRKFFGAVKLIEQKETWDEIAVAKGRKLIPPNFYKIMMALMRKVDVGSEEEKMKNFDTFVKFFESIVAYHKFYTGK